MSLPEITNGCRQLPIAMNGFQRLPQTGKGAKVLTWVDHVNIVLNRNLDDLVNGEVGLDWRVLPALSDFVCLIRLCNARAIVSTSSIRKYPAVRIVLERGNVL
jgi:hypothetical protein